MGDGNAEMRWLVGEKAVLEAGRLTMGKALKAAALMGVADAEAWDVTSYASTTADIEFDKSTGAKRATNKLLPPPQALKHYLGQFGLPDLSDELFAATSIYFTHHDVWDGRSLDAICKTWPWNVTTRMEVISAQRKWLREQQQSFKRSGENRQFSRQLHHRYHEDKPNGSHHRRP